MRRALPIVVALCLLAACSSNGSDKPAASAGSTTIGTTAPTTTAATTTTTTTPAPSTTIGSCGAGSTQPVTTTTASSTALLRAVQAVGAGCADRVTFDFTTKENAPPKCTIAYDQPPFTQDGSGASVQVAGSAFIRVRCNPAYGYDFESGKPTYTGPRQLTPTGTKHVRQLVEIGDFEGVLTWIVGLDAQRPFAVTTTTVTGPQAINRLAIRIL